MTIKELFFKPFAKGYFESNYQTLILDEFNNPSSELNLCKDSEIVINNDDTISLIPKKGVYVLGVEIDIENDIALNININSETNKVINIIYSNEGLKVFEINF